jgi:hypothetical protein
MGMEANAKSSSTTTTAATPTLMTGTSTMTFTIYQEGRLESSSSTPSPQGISCDQNLPISSFSAIGDDGDDALPQNAFDNDLGGHMIVWDHG